MEESLLMAALIVLSLLFQAAFWTTLIVLSKKSQLRGTTRLLALARTRSLRRSDYFVTFFRERGIDDRVTETVQSFLRELIQLPFFPMSPDDDLTKIYGFDGEVYLDSIQSFATCQPHVQFPEGEREHDNETGRDGGRPRDSYRGARQD